MAERRMFAKTIIDSDAFLDMPLSTQALYFHLSMRADDDGFINNPKKVQRVIGASLDDLKLLVAKKFIIPFESGVVVIKHWKIHNYIQKDRYKETVYQEEKNQLAVKKNGSYTITDTECIQPVSKLETQDRIGKDRIGKVSIDKNTCQKIIDLYHEHCPSLPKVIKLTDVRQRAIATRLKTYTEDDLVKAFDKAEASDFLRKGSGTWHGASFDWIMNPSNLVKILEGNYDNREKQDEAAAELDESYEMMRRWSES